MDVVKKVNTVFEAVQKVMQNLEAVAKSKTNTAGPSFKFRGVDDVYNAIHRHLAEHGVFTVPRQLERIEEKYKSNSGTNMLRVILKTEFDFYGADGSKFTAGPFYTESNDASDKSTNKGASVAHRTALVQVFCIPTEEDKDQDSQSPENPTPPTTTTRPILNLAPKPDKVIPLSGSISDKQLKRMFAIQKSVFEKSGHWSVDEVKTFMQAKIGVESAKDLDKKSYDKLILIIETKTPEEAYS